MEVDGIMAIPFCPNKVKPFRSTNGVNDGLSLYVAYYKHFVLAWLLR